jgi:neutral trehalase
MSGPVQKKIRNANGENLLPQLPLDDEVNSRRDVASVLQKNGDFTRDFVGHRTAEGLFASSQPLGESRVDTAISVEEAVDGLLHQDASDISLPSDTTLPQEGEIHQLHDGGYSTFGMVEALVEPILPQKTRLDIEHDSRIQECKDYAEDVRRRSIVSHTKYDPKTGNLGLRYPFRVPTPVPTDEAEAQKGTQRFTHVQFYHDSYFMGRPDLRTEEGRKLNMGVIDNSLQMLKKYRTIPNYSSEASLLSTQIPLLTPLIMETYHSFPDKDTKKRKEWLRKCLDGVVDERNTVWRNPRDLKEGLGTYHHRVRGYRNSRAGDRDAGYAWNAVREIGDDFSTVRYGGKHGGYADKILPIDVNAVLYRNEKYIAEAYEILGEKHNAERWNKMAALRAEEMHQLMFDQEKQYPFDYRYDKQERTGVYTLAAGYWLWSGVATGEQAKAIVEQIYEKFDGGYGLTTTDPKDTPTIPTAEQYRSIGVEERFIETQQQDLETAQWDENMWPPRQQIFTLGLIRYATSEDKGLSNEDKLFFLQKAIYNMETDITTMVNAYHKEKEETGVGTLPEKFKPDGQIQKDAYHYPFQRDFGWMISKLLDEVQTLPELYALEDKMTTAMEAKGVVETQANEQQVTTQEVTVFVPEMIPAYEISNRPTVSAD